MSVGNAEHLRVVEGGGGSPVVDRDLAYRLLRSMLMIRQIDTRCFQLNRQGKIPFAVGSEGHEAVQAGAGAALKGGSDILVPYYRDTGLCLALGMQPIKIFRSQFARATDSGGGRQFPSHWSARRYGIMSVSSIVAAQLPHAVGAAYAIKVRNNTNGIVVASFGEGATSEGEWHESMNFASVHKLPILMLCQNNGWAISTPQSRQMAVADVADRGSAYGMRSMVVDGMDPIAVYEAVKFARERVVEGEPMLIEAKCRRFRPHSTDDDDRAYRPREEIEENRGLDPISRFAQSVVFWGLIDAPEIEVLKREIVDEVNRCTDEAEAEPYPSPGDLYRHVMEGDWHPWQ